VADARADTHLIDATYLVTSDQVDKVAGIQAGNALGKRRCAVCYRLAAARTRVTIRPTMTATTTTAMTT